MLNSTTALLHTPAGQLAFDANLPAVRVAVLEGLQLLVDNQHAQPVLKVWPGSDNSINSNHLPSCMQIPFSLTQLPQLSALHAVADLADLVGCWAVAAVGNCAAATLHSTVWRTE
jgi:hypothetical protein